MTDKMQTGHVYRIIDGAFGIVTYFPRTDVLVALLPGVTNARDACEALRRTHAGRFVEADRDTRLWGEALFESRGSALML